MGRIPAQDPALYLYLSLSILAGFLRASSWKPLVETSCRECSRNGTSLPSGRSWILVSTFTPIPLQLKLQDWKVGVNPSSTWSSNFLHLSLSLVSFKARVSLPFSHWRTIWDDSEDLSFVKGTTYSWQTASQTGEHTMCMDLYRLFKWSLIDWPIRRSLSKLSERVRKLVLQKLSHGDAAQSHLSSSRMGVEALRHRRH